jgi:hypothetical protein
LSRVYVLRDDGTSTAMSRVRCKNEDRELQRILEGNFDLLPGDQIDPEDPRRWLLIKREMAVPGPGSGTDLWSIDFLFADQDAKPTFVECKRFADTRSRREVVGQMLEYAANGHHYWSKDDLRDAASASAAAAGSSLEAQLQRLLPNGAATVDDFFDLVQENLRQGLLRLVFFLEESSPELRSVVEFLNAQMDADVLLVEARQYSHQGSKVVVPTLFGYTEQARATKRVVAVKSSGGRRRWDEPTYFADAAAKLQPEHLVALRALYEHFKGQRYEVDWGTGLQNGSFNVKYPRICPRSLISCYSNGDVTFNLGWLTGSDVALRAQAKLRDLAMERLGLSPTDVERTVPIISWFSKTGEVSQLLDEVVESIHFPLG